MDWPATVEWGEGRVENNMGPIGPRRIGPCHCHGVLLLEAVDRRYGRESACVGQR